MGSVKKDLTKGVFWIAVSKYSGIVIQLLIAAILARIIEPASFGTIAVAMVVLHFLNILADIGIGPAVVQYKQLTKQHLNSLFTLNLYIGVILALALFLLSGVIAAYYVNESLREVCQLMTLVIFFQSLNVVPNALMRKDKRFRTIALRTLFFQILSGIIAVWGAFHGWDVYALLVSPILTAVGVFLVNYYNYPLRFVAQLSKDAIKMVGSFSLYQFAFSFCNYFSRNLDKLIIGKFFSMSQLGYYEKSYHLMMLPVQNVSFVIDPVLHPILSMLQNDKHTLKEKNQKLTVLISNLSFPIGLTLFFCGSELIKIVYGNQWDAAIPVFRILALSLPLQMILSVNASIFQAAGKTNHLFISGLLNSFFTVVGFFIAVYCGGTIEAVAWSWDITLTINFINTYTIMHIFTLGERVIPYFSSLLPQVLNSVLTFILLFFIGDFFTSNLFVSLAYKTTLIGLSTVVLATLLRQYSVKDIYQYVRESLSRK